MSPPSSSTSKPTTTTTTTPTTKSPKSRSHHATSSSSSSSSSSSLKSRILSSLTKLSDRDTNHIAVSDLETLITSPPSPDSLPLLLSSLLSDPHSDSLRLLSLLSSAHPSIAAPSLPKILSSLLRHLADPAARDACLAAAGSLAATFLAVPDSNGSLVRVFVRPLLEAMGEQSRNVQAGAAACLAKVVECGGGGGGFGKLCLRVCKMVAGQGVVAKGPLLSIFASLAQVGAISPQNMPAVLQSIRECLGNSDWATRKAAADTLIVLACHSSHLVTDSAASTIASLEACRFDKVKPVRDSITEGLQLWKKLINGEDTSQNSKDGTNNGSTNSKEKMDNTKINAGLSITESLKDSSATSPAAKDSFPKEKDSNIPEKAVVILKKRMPSLTDKELNPDFFQKMETRSTDDLPVEVVVPRRCPQSSHSQGEEPDMNVVRDSLSPKQNGTVCNKSNDSDSHAVSSNCDSETKQEAYKNLHESYDFTREKWIEQRGFRSKDSRGRALDAYDGAERSQRETSATRLNFSRNDDGSFVNNKGNWLTIQRQLSQLERQQVNLMNMLQDFMGGSHDSMITLENRVRGLERVVEVMAQDLSLSSGRRGGNSMLGFEGSPGRSSNKYTGLHDYFGPKFGRGTESRMPFAERYLASDSILSGVRGREPPWDSYANGSSRNGLMNSRRGLSTASVDGRSPRTELDGDQPGSRRAWDKGQGPFRLGEGPSARSVWQASKDEATLEAIRVAGDDNGTSRIPARRAVAELDGEALTDDNAGQERGPLWALWSRAMDSLHVGDVDSAYAEVVSSGDEMLLVKLMEQSGPVADQLSNEVACEVLNAVSQFLPEQNLADIALTWIQQFAELIVDNGVDIGMTPEVKRDVLLSLYEASAMDLPEDWDGLTLHQIMMQLGSAWGINVQQLLK